MSLGMYAARSGEPPLAIADLSGHVLKRRVLVNSTTEKPFVWAWIQTAGMNLEVVGDPDDIQGDLAAGAIVRGIFWLTATIERPAL